MLVDAVGAGEGCVEVSANGLVKDKESNERASFSAKQAHLGLGSRQEPFTQDGCPPSAERFVFPCYSLPIQHPAKYPDFVSGG